MGTVNCFNKKKESPQNTLMCMSCLQLRAMRVMVANDILKDAQVICATCVGAGELIRLVFLMFSRRVH